MSMVTPTLNLPQPAPASTAAKPALSTSTPSTSATSSTPSTPPAPGTPSSPPAVPSTTVTLSPQAQSAYTAASHPAAAPSSAAATAPAAAIVAHDASVYDSLKNGISTAVGDVGDVIVGGAQAVVDGVENTLSAANKIVQGALGLPFAAAAKVCDAAGAIISEL